MRCPLSPLPPFTPWRWGPGAATRAETPEAASQPRAGSFPRAPRRPRTPPVISAVQKRGVVHAFVQAVVKRCQARVRSVVGTSIEAFVRVLVRAFTDAFDYLLACLSVRSFIAAFGDAFIHSFVHSSVRSCIRSWIRSFILRTEQLVRPMAAWKKHCTNQHVGRLSARAVACVAKVTMMKRLTVTKYCTPKYSRKNPTTSISCGRDCCTDASS